MNLKKLLGSLHPLEREVLPVLDKYNALNDIINITGLKEVQVMRALQWLQNKKIITLKEDLREIVNLDANGKHYLKEGLPEKRLLEAISKKELSISQTVKEARLVKEEINIGLGVLRDNAAIFVTKDKKIKILDQGKKLLQKGLIEERFLKKEFPVEVTSLRDEEKLALKKLKRRKNIIKIDVVKLKTAELTEIGREILESGVKIGDVIDKLTANILKDGSWEDKKFRRYDIKINVPKIYSSKKQPYRRFLDEVRQKFLAMGFKEMQGPIVETEFWNMDALFMPQFHSARDIHQGYHIKKPQYALDLPKELVSNVKKAHENGFNTGSKGWQYEFDVKRTHRHLLRTQGTALSAKKLAASDLEIPGKYFALVRCFRYDVIDNQHLADFNQVEGIVVEEGLNFRHLKGLLKLFAEEFAETDQVKITPGYFPFTEPSAELHAKHPDLGWIELAGSGIFRPEMCKPFGVNAPVLAWGVGIDRIAMFKLGIKDIRDLFSHDLNFLRNSKVV